MFLSLFLLGTVTCIEIPYITVTHKPSVSSNNYTAF